MGDPPAIVFDEAHYVRWGREISQGHITSDSGNLRDLPVNYEHPPLAKHLIAGSMRWFHTGQTDLTWHQYYEGCVKAAEATKDHGPQPCPEGRTWPGCQDPHPQCRREAFAFRLPSMALGSLGVASAYVAGLRLLRSLAGGLLAATFLLLDTLWYLQSRMALLDVFAAALAMAALAAALGPTWRHRVLSGILLGLGLAAKFPALFLAPVLLLIHGWNTPGTSNPFTTWTQRLYGETSRVPPTVDEAHKAIAPWRRLVRGAFYALVLPLVTYVLVYAPYILQWMEAKDFGYAVAQFLLTQGTALAQDYGFTFKHGSRAPPLWWIPQVNPTFYYCPTCPTWSPPLMYALGNVALWFPAAALALALPVAIAIRWFKRTWKPYASFDYFRAIFWRPLARTPEGNLMLASLVFLSSYAPWFLVRHTPFNFYATLLVPSLALVAAGAGAWLWERGARARNVAIAHVGIVGGWFMAWWPMAAGAYVHPSLFNLLHNLLPWLFLR